MFGVFCYLQISHFLNFLKSFKFLKLPDNFLIILGLTIKGNIILYFLIKFYILCHFLKTFEIGQNLLAINLYNLFQCTNVNWNNSTLLWHGKVLADIFLFKVNNGNTRVMCEISSMLTIKILERRHWKMEHTVHMFFYIKISVCQQLQGKRTKKTKILQVIKLLAFFKNHIEILTFEARLDYA